MGRAVRTLADCMFDLGREIVASGQLAVDQPIHWAALAATSQAEPLAMRNRVEQSHHAVGAQVAQLDLRRAIRPVGYGVVRIGGELRQAAERSRDGGIALEWVSDR